MIKKLKNKKGFTLIEIIVVIAIIGIIGVSGTVLVIKGRENSLNKKRDAAFKVFDNALDVYLSNHSEILKNLDDNAEGAVVTFEVLKNEGLVADNIIDPKTNAKVDYKNNYYVLSDAVMLKNEDETEEGVCDGQVSLNVLKSWNTLSDKVNTDDIIYVCPKSNNNDNTYDDSDLRERINQLEVTLSLLSGTSKNYVLFDVSSNSSEYAYWSNVDTDLWQIVSTANGEIRLLYSQPVGSNNYFKVSQDNLWQKNKCEKTSKNNYKNSSFVRIADNDANEDNDIVTCMYDNIAGCVIPNDSGNTYYSTVNYLRYKDTNGNYRYFKYSKNNKFSNGYTNSSMVLANAAVNYADFKAITKTTLEALNSISEDEFKKINTQYFCSGDKEDEGDKDDCYYRYDSLTGWSYDDIHKTVNTTNSKKKALFDAINSNLQGKIGDSDNYYEYKIQVAGNDLAEDRTTSQEDKLGVLSLSEIRKIYQSSNNFLIGKKFIIGKYTNNDWDKTDMLVFITNGVITDTGKEIHKEYSWSGGTNRHAFSYKISTGNYYPVITLTNNPQLLTSISEYPSSYKECTTEKLGSKECPYIIKFDDGTYSHNGNKTL